MTPRWRSASILAAAGLLGGCDPLFSVCHVCLESDSTRAVPNADRALVLRADKDHPLPASASDLRYHEECGIDCTMWFRFEVPTRDADAFVTAVFLGGDPLPGDDATRRAPLCGETACPWWPPRFPRDARAYADEMSGPVNRVAIVQREDTRATVWLIVAET